ncbi:MAG TPA: DNA repair protein RecO [Kofleriaceae bacterium]|jgi:DNA repair protein RecO (recombination protein O)
MEADLGVVLKTTPLRESDLLVVLYTSERGRIAAVARGARKSQRRFSGALQLLVLGRYQLGRRPRGELWSLESADVEREWSELARDVIAVAHASYAAELVASLLPPEAPDPHALALIVSLWDALAQGGPSVGALRAFEISLLELAGHGPALAGCAACGSTDLEAGALFDPDRGGAICRRCGATSRGPGVRPIDAATLAYLRAAAAAESPVTARALDADPAFAPADRTAGRDAVVAMVQGLVGRPLKSLEYIAKLGAARYDRGR